MNPELFSDEELRQLIMGGVVTIGSKRYSICPDCLHAIHMNKLLGSIHFCAHESQKASNREWLADARRRLTERADSLSDAIERAVRESPEVRNAIRRVVEDGHA